MRSHNGEAGRTGWRCMLGALVMLVLTGVTVAEAGAGVDTTPSRIDAAVASGSITRFQGDLLLVVALADYDLLPAAFRGEDRWDATISLRHLHRRLEAMPPGPRRDLLAALTGARFDTTDPGGPLPLVPGAVNDAIEDSPLMPALDDIVALVPPSPLDPGVLSRCASTAMIDPNREVTTHFVIHWESPTSEETVHAVAEALESAWVDEIEAYGWVAPPTVDTLDGLYPVMIDPEMDPNTLGFVYHVGSHAGNVGDNPNSGGFIEDDAQATCMVLNGKKIGDPLTLIATVVHELNHSIQYGLGALTGDDAAADVFVEGGAVWMELDLIDDDRVVTEYSTPDVTRSLADYGDRRDINIYRYGIVFRAMTEPMGVGVPGGGEEAMQSFWELPAMTGGTEYNLGAFTTAFGGDQSFHDAAVALFALMPCGEHAAPPHCLEDANLLLEHHGQIVPYDFSPITDADPKTFLLKPDFAMKAVSIFFIPEAKQYGVKVSATEPVLASIVESGFTEEGDETLDVHPIAERQSDGSLRGTYRLGSNSDAALVLTSGYRGDPEPPDAPEFEAEVTVFPLDIGHDFNCDGFGDRAVGEDEYATPSSITVFYGDEGGLSRENVQLLDGSTLGTSLRPSVAQTGIDGGDFDGDGCDDIVFTSFGQATVVHGSSEGLDLTRVVAAPTGDGVQPIAIAAGDIDGDGIDDFALFDYDGGATTYFGGYEGISPERSNFVPEARYAASPSRRARGDFDGDGRLDVALTHRENLGYYSIGVVEVLHGGPAGFVSVARRWTRSDLGGGFSHLNNGYFGDLRFGRALAAGDFDGDGFDDLAIGHDNDWPEANRQTGGSVRILSGSPSGPTGDGFQYWHPAREDVPGDLPESRSESRRFGYALAAGDLNGDLVDDLVIGDPLDLPESSQGSIRVLYGSTDDGLTGEGADYLGAPAPRAMNGFGAVLATADHDADGYGDLTVGSPYSDRNPYDDEYHWLGAFSVFRGGDGGLGFFERDHAAITTSSEGVPGSSGDYDSFGMAFD